MSDPGRCARLLHRARSPLGIPFYWLRTDTIHRAWAHEVVARPLQQKWEHDPDSEWIELNDVYYLSIQAIETGQRSSPSGPNIQDLLFEGDGTKSMRKQDAPKRREKQVTQSGTRLIRANGDESHV